MNKPLGDHYLIELYDCHAHILDDEDRIQATLLEAATKAGATIIDQKFHKFAPQGVSGVVVIAESHISIHTWPELGYAALDFFTCGHTMTMDRAFELLREVFQPGDMEVRRVARGIIDPAQRSQGGVRVLERVSA